MSKVSTITAILCNYNGAAYLQEAIDSVINQTRLPEEFIIVDDASTDSSKEIIRKVTQRNPALIKFIEHPQQRGQAAGFNTAASASTGDLLAFLDSDDLWFPQKLERMQHKSMNCPGFGLLQHNLQILQGRELLAEPVMPGLVVGDAFELWQRYQTFPNFVPTSGLMVRKAIFEQIGPIPETLRISADSFLTRAAISLGPVESTLDCLGAYRRHAQNNVAGNSKHDSWQFFLKNVSPRLAEFYERTGRPLPRHIQMPTSSKLSNGRFFNPILDLSPRRVLRVLKKWTRTGESSK
ncbi:MAG TPA: glycosyltransferase [Verrucomicrobiota bacterium]|nr:hypothetical protein [Verrucomicrobiales bacterium]HRI11749.1 glycosyltransferase [Verrucomicrobiota bacterium]